MDKNGGNQLNGKINQWRGVKNSAGKEKLLKPRGKMFGHLKCYETFLKSVIEGKRGKGRPRRS